MNNWLTKIYKNRKFLIFILLFAYIQSIYMRFSVRQEFSLFLFTPEAAFVTFLKSCILSFIILTLINRLPKPGVFGGREAVQVFGLSIVVFVLVMKVLALITATAVDTVERNFNSQTFLYSMFSDLLDGFIYGSFFLTYHYYKVSRMQQDQVMRSNQANAESKIHQLKSQLNPHFLFNNLNVLDQLIEEGKEKASAFLNEFAEIYRYVLQASEKKLVRLSDELSFAKQYFNLFQHKYGTAYQMTIQQQNQDGYIVPLTLQLLIENAIQHNLGTEENPVLITISVSHNICVSNNVCRKRVVKPTNGRALKNLQEQYKLLAERNIEIQRSDDFFSVNLPLIETSTV